jgi:predicted Rossmann-fold nucleotide-binding protein
VGQKREIDFHNLDNWLASTKDCSDLVFQALDLRPYDVAISMLPQAKCAAEGCVFLGCQIGPQLSAASATNHALIFPDLPGRPYKPYRQGLYSPNDLFDLFDHNRPDSYLDCTDWKTYTSYIKVDQNNKPIKPVQYVEVGPDEILARRLHDHFITDELEEFLAAFRPPLGKGIVGIMGGHDLSRSDSKFREVAHLSRNLTKREYLVTSGGGPGLMEAANLGAYFAAFDDPASLDTAIERLKKADTYKHPHWLKVAWEVLIDNPTPSDSKNRSLGIPTWFYGHEPPNVFATHIAKYFENSLREEGLLAIASHGVVFAEGNAGTVQEIFQDACQNYYENYGFKSPMILFGEDYWDPLPGPNGTYPNKTKPVWPLLLKMAQENQFTNLVTKTSDADEILSKVTSFQPPRTNDT